VPGLLIVAPALGPESATVKVLLPENGVAVLTATENDFAAVSPSAHFNVPVAAVKSVPPTAVPLFVEYETLAEPLDPPTRFAVTFKVPALCETA